MRAVGVGLLAVLAWASAAPAATHRVPEDYASIQEAIDAAAEGDSVLVGPGTWTGGTRTIPVCANLLMVHSVIFLRPGLTVIGTAGPGETILDGGPEEGAAVETVILANMDGPVTEVRGFTITGGGEGITLACSNSHIDVVDCHIIDNVGMGVDVSSVSATLRDCVVRNNSTDGVFGLAAVSSFSSEFGRAHLEAIDTRFESNSNGAMLLDDPGTVVIDGCEFVNNAPVRTLAINSGSNVTIRNSLFLGNRSENNGGAFFASGSLVAIEFNTFAYDSAGGPGVSGGAIALAANCFATIRNNTFYRCDAIAGSALSISQSTVTVANNVFAGATNDEYGTLAQLSGTTIRAPESGCNILWDNTADYLLWDEAAMATDIHLDPDFCDPGALGLTVSGSSPALSQNSPQCGAIGAFGQGCGSVGVTPSSWGRLKALYRN